MKNLFKNKVESMKNWYWFIFKIKRDEFDSSLDLDHRQMVGKSEEEKTKYIMDLVKRRNLAHDLDNELTEIKRKI